MYFEIQKSASF